MEKNKTSFRSVTLLEIALLIIVSAAAYLPFLLKLGYYFDDWYLMYAAGTRGAEVFQDIFSVDRPGRAFVMMPLYSLFGGNPLYYNLSAYFLRLLGAFGFLSLLRSLWERERAATLAMTVLFLVYPGFLSQPNAIDYQSHLAGLAAAIWSIALTLRALSSSRWVERTGFFTLSILLGFFYLSQIEWYIGFEATRWIGVIIITFRDGGSLGRAISRSIQSAFPVLIIPVVFLAWRLLFFESERGATDVGMQLGGLSSAPLSTIGLWAISMAQDMVDVLILAWVSPLTRYAFTMDTTHKLIGFGLGILAVAMTLITLKRGETISHGDRAQDPGWRREVMWFGFAALIFGLLPVTLANREVTFPSFSRYTLASSAGAVMIILAALNDLANIKLRQIILLALVLFSVLTHYGNGYEHARWAEEYRTFWWQVAWRIPQMAGNTTLVAQYPASGTEEDYFIWGPANLIYSPVSANERKVQPALFAAILNQETMISVLLREGQDFSDRRSIVTFTNYRNILVIAQPTPESCARVIEGSQVELSSLDQPRLMAVAPFSEAGRILADEAGRIPPVIPFGDEPPHTWCYFYEKASLARQRGDWEMVLALGNEAMEKGFSPYETIEWMPFLQAYAQAGDVDRLNDLAAVIRRDRFVSMQVCRIIGTMQGISAPVIDLVDSQYCLE